VESLGTQTPPAGKLAPGMAPAAQQPAAGMSAAGMSAAGMAPAEPSVGEPEAALRAGDPAAAPGPSRWRRARRVMLFSTVALVLLIAGTLVTGLVTASRYLSDMRRISNPFAAIPASARAPMPTGAAARDVTFLVGGLDTQSPVPTTGKQAKSSIRGRTDTLMLVHLIAGGRGAYVVSIPRDSWVPIPGHGYGKINWAYSYGGPTLAIRTVEHLTNVRINHFAIIDWAGFRDVTNALGGVSVTIPVTSYDPMNHVTWTAGRHHLDGRQALLYVRDRYGLASGDFDRERRQQYFLRAVFKQLRQAGTLANPLRMGPVLHALSDAVSVDSTLSDSEMIRLALGLGRLKSSQIVFAIAPYSGTGTAGDQSVVWLSHSADRGFWHAFEYDSLPAYMRAHGLQQLGSSTP